MAEEAPYKPLIGLTCRWDEEHDWFYLSSDYALAVAAAGGVPVLVPLIPEEAAALAGRLDAFVLCGSASDVDPSRYGEPCHPEVQMVHPQRDATDCRMLGSAFHDRKPVFGICFGMQSLNVYLTGSLIQHIPATVPGALEHKDRLIRHEVHLEPGSRLWQWAEAQNTALVNSTHHQAVGRLGRGLRVAARAPDGVIEAVEGDFPNQFVVAVQWHPERIWQEELLSARLFHELVRAAAQWRSERRAQDALVD